MDRGEYTSWVSCKSRRISFDTREAVGWVDGDMLETFV